MGAGRGFLFLINMESGGYDVKVARNIEKSEIDPGKFEFSRGIVEKVLNTGKEVLIADALKDPTYSSMKSVLLYKLRSILCVPMVLKEKLIGIIYIDNHIASNVFSDEDRVLLTSFAAQAAISYDNARTYRELEKERNSLEEKVTERTRELQKAYNIIKEDLAMAKNVQQNILPVIEKGFPGMDISIRYEPMSEIGGDIYDIFELREGYIRIFIADATGHGVQASLMTMLVKSEYERVKSILKEPGSVLEQLNNSFYKTYYNLSLFFTGFIIDIDLINSKIIFSSGGHPIQYLLRESINIMKDSGVKPGKKPVEIIELQSPGQLIGCIENRKYTHTELQFLPGDRILLFTDGLFEQFNNEGIEYGEERFKDLLINNTGTGIKDLERSIFNDLNGFIGKMTRNDDITYIGIKIL